MHSRQSRNVLLSLAVVSVVACGPKVLPHVVPCDIQHSGEGPSLVATKLLSKSTLPSLPTGSSECLVEMTIDGQGHPGTIDTSACGLTAADVRRVERALSAWQWCATGRDGTVTSIRLQ